MEWVLQVVDELDDLIGAIRHGLIGLTASIAAVVSAFGAGAKISEPYPRPHP